MSTDHVVMAWSSAGPSVVAPCQHCRRDTVWLRSVHGGWHLFDADMFATADSFAGNRFAIRRRARDVIDLDCVLESRWPAKCLRLHKYGCPESFDQARYYKRRPRQINDVDLSDMWERIAENARPSRDDDLGWAG